MSGAFSRLSRLAAHLVTSSSSPTAADPVKSEYKHRYNFHTLSPTAFLPRAAAIEPGAEAIYHVTANGKILRRSYQEAADRARGLAYYLKKHNFKRVGILCPNTPAFLESIYGIAAAGAINVGLVTQVANEEDVMALAYTSGTTARPKGVEFTHRGAYLAALANVIESGLNYHGWTFPWAVTAVRGTHYCLRKIDYPEIWRLLKAEQITHFNAAPTVNTLLCNAKEAERVKDPVRVTVAASPPTAHLFEQMTNLNLLPVHVYGLTETYGPITKGYHMPAWEEMPLEEKYRRMARQGHGFVTSLPVRVVKTDVPEGSVVDVEKNGKEIGEIVYTGNICAKGYYKDAEATRKLWAGGVSHSGDLAVWHPDGAVQILDRAKDIIISGGENISSLALESMLVTHPDVLEAACVAVADSHWGERPKAFVTIKEGKQLKGEDLIDWAKHKSGISKFMVPREVEIVTELPKTSTGKLQKNVLREWAKGGDRTMAK
ncbi:hypothetical protein LTR16_001994 [Cryomyces antarcticus]|uniref:Uncharacterized protein n=1 Tax=Cryomyces antarcticus TaxID=329879 RepID=A0ABR0LPW2_9PEZI|nr:hypothetical protein LTR16_001994 [Cryomyces antarcticus]